MDDGFRVHDLLAFAVSVAVVLFYVADTGIFADVEGMDAIVLRTVVAAAVDAAAGDDDDVGSFSDIKIIVYDVLEASLAQDDGNMHGFVLRFRLNIHVDARTIFLRFDFDMSRRSTADALTVRADIICSFRNAMQISNDFQQMFLILIHQTSSL